MAQPTTARPGKMRILLGNGATPTEVFTAPCGLTSKSLTVNKDFGEVAIPDCDDPDAPLWMSRDVSTISISVDGEGLLAAESEEVWNDANFSTESVNSRIEIEFTTGTRIFAGAFHVTCSVSAQQGQRVSVSVSLVSDGIITSTWDAA